MMVAPEREVPGNSENAWAMPTLKASPGVISAMLCTRAAVLVPTLDDENEKPADDQRRADRDRAEQVGLDVLVQRQSDNRRRQKGDKEIEGKRCSGLRCNPVTRSVTLAR